MAKYSLRINRIPEETLRIKHFQTVTLPASVDLRPNLPPVYNQGNLGSCTANALVAAFQFKMPSFLGSRLFLYYNERKIENNIANDGGAYLSDGIKAMEIYGICPEISWSYNIKKFAVCPPKSCYTEALKERVITACNITQTEAAMKTALNAATPFVVGIRVFVSFESPAVAKTGIVPMPGPREQCLGGHAVLVCGYDDVHSWWIVRNSWGPAWGVNGYFYLPYAYLTDPKLCSDIWAISTITPPIPNPKKRIINPYLERFTAWMRR